MIKWFKCLTVLVMMPCSVLAAERVWTGGSGDGSWSSGGNWKDGQKPADGDSAVLSAVGLVDGKITLSESISLGKLTITGGGSLTIDGSGVLTFTENDAFACNGTCAVTHRTPVVLTAGMKKFMLAKGAKVIFAGPISGDGGIDVLGDVTNIGINDLQSKAEPWDTVFGLAGDNSYAGGTKASHVALEGLSTTAFGAANSSVTFGSTSAGGDVGEIGFAAEGVWRSYNYMIGFTPYIFFRRSCTVSGNFGIGGWVTYYVGTSNGVTVEMEANCPGHYASKIFPLVGKGASLRLHSAITVGSFLYGWDVGDGTGNITFCAEGNAYGADLSVARNGAYACGAANVLSPTSYLSTTGKGVDSDDASSAYIDLNGFDQVVAGLRGDYPTYGGGYLKNSSETPATLTMNGAESCTSYMLVRDNVSLVWNPSDAVTLTMKDRINTTTGALIVSNGTFKVDGSATFSQVRKIEVATGAVFEVTTTAEASLASVEEIHVAAGGTFRVADGVLEPFDNSVTTLRAESGSAFVIPAAAVYRFDALYLDDQPIDGGEHSSADFSPLSGGKIVSKDAPREPVEATWNGGAGSNTAVGEGANWQGGEVPNLTVGTLLPLFGEGGSEASIPSAVDFIGLRFGGSSSEFDLVGPGPLSVRNSGIVSVAAHTNKVSVPLVVMNDETWEIGAGSLLEMSGGWSSRYGVEMVTKLGGGDLVLSSSAGLVGPFTVGDAAEDAGAVYVEATTNAFGEASLSPITVNSVASSKPAGGRIVFLGDSVVERPAIFNANGAYYSLDISSNSLVRFTKPVSSTGIFRPRILTGSKVVMEDGASFKGEITTLEGHLDATLEVRGAPLNVSYLYLVGGPAVEVDCGGGELGTLELSGGRLRMNAPNVFISGVRNIAMYSTSSEVDLNGNDQEFGEFRNNSPKGMLRSDSPACFSFTQSNMDVTNCQLAIEGAVAVAKKGPRSFVVNAEVSSSGGIEVLAGTFAFGENGSWTNAPTVAVSGTGRLELPARKVLGRNTELAVSDSGVIAVADGGQSACGTLKIDGKPVSGGLYGGVDAPAGVNKEYAAHFSGTGILRVRHPTGFAISIR